MSQIRSLVFGGAGFIGSHLVERLLETGRRVCVVDNMQYCYSDNLSTVEDRQDLIIKRADACDYDMRKMSMVLYDEIYHLAGELADIIIDQRDEDLVAFAIEGKMVAVVHVQLNAAAVRGNVSVFKGILEKSVLDWEKSIASE